MCVCVCVRKVQLARKATARTQGRNDTTRGANNYIAFFCANTHT